MAAKKQLYAVPIDDALSDPKTKLSTLKSLQKTGYKTLASHGDLKGALKKLDRAIKAHGKKK
ncbi:MAG: DUF1843 domain-containing protein [Alphaproteobacteria bacterium]